MVSIGEFRVFRVNCESDRGRRSFSLEEKAERGEAGDEWAGCKIKQKSGSDPVRPGGIYRHFAQRLHPFHPPFRARKIGRSSEENSRKRESRHHSAKRLCSLVPSFAFRSVVPHRFYDFRPIVNAHPGVWYRVDTANAFYIKYSSPGSVQICTDTE